MDVRGRFLRGGLGGKGRGRQTVRASARQRSAYAQWRETQAARHQSRKLVGAEGSMFLFEGGAQSPSEIEALIEELVGPTEAASFWRQYRKSYLTKADIAFIRRCGFNSVRIPLHYKFFLTDAGFDLLDPVIDWCREDSLWVILDMHCVAGRPDGHEHRR